MPERKAYAILFLFTYSKGPRCLQVGAGTHGRGWTGGEGRRACRGGGRGPGG